MNHTTRQRIARLENRMRERDCRTCFNQGTALVHVPTHDEKGLPEYNPTHCEECGRPLHLVRQIIGVSRETAARLHSTRERMA